MGTYLSIPFASRRVLQVEPSPKVAVKRDDLEVKDGNWVCGPKDPKGPEDDKSLMEEIADLSRPLTPYEANDFNEDVNVLMSPMSPIHEEQIEEEKEEVKEEVKDVQEEKDLLDSMEMIHNVMKNVIINRNEYKEDKMDIVEEPKIEVPRIPEFQPNFNSASHAIKKFNRRHRKH